MHSLNINEIYYSVQGESTFAGFPCIFIRLTWCNLRCTYCDTEYAFYEGKEMTFQQIKDEIKKYDCRLVEITGGEPLVQKRVHQLMTELSDEGYNVLIETGGSLPIQDIDPRVTVIMDLKCPSSGMMHKNRYENLKYLKPTDELKFVIGSEEDYTWAKETIQQHQLSDKCRLLFSTVFSSFTPKELVDLILRDNLPVRFQLQMHKYIWDPSLKGV